MFDVDGYRQLMEANGVIIDAPDANDDSIINELAAAVVMALQDPTSWPQSATSS